MDIIAVGNMLRDARLEKRMRQSDVAALVGMTASNYARYERGVYPNMSVDKLAEIADVLSIPSSKLAEVVMSRINDKQAISSFPNRVKVKTKLQSEQKDNKKVTLESLRNNPPRKYAASSSAKMTDEDAEYLHKQLEAINEEEEKGDWE